MPTRFGYLRDPLFLFSVGLYLINRFLIRSCLIDPPSFFHSYLNDCLCIPFWLPPTLCLYRRLGLRSHDRPPSPPEIATHVILWSVFFEIAAPSLPPFRGITTADPWDIVCYASGASVAGIFWNAAEIAVPQRVTGRRGGWRSRRQRAIF